MKRFWLIALFAGLALASAPGRQQTLVIGGNFNDLISLDPAVVYEFSGILVDSNIYQTLVKFNGNNYSKLRPDLAKSWTVTKKTDSWLLSFKLGNHEFASGNPVTAQDVVYSFDRVIKLNQTPAFLFTSDASLKLGDITAPNSRTVDIKLPLSVSPQDLLSILAFSVGDVVDQKVVQTRAQGNDMGMAWLRDHSAGSGSYVLNHWSQGSQVVLTASPVVGNNVALKRIVLQQMADPQAQKIAVQTNEIDIAWNPTPLIAKYFKNKTGFTVATMPSFLLVYEGMNVAYKPLSNPLVRQAIRYTINYRGIVDHLLSGNGIVMQTIIPKGLLGFNPDTPYHQDIAKAKALLAQAGYPNGFNLQILTGNATAPGGVTWRDLASTLQADLGKAGIRATIRQTTGAELLGIYRAQKGQLVLYNWGPDFPDPDGNVSPFVNYAAKELAYRNSFQDPKLTKLATQAALEQSPAKRAKMYKTITSTLLEQGPYAVLYEPVAPFVLRSVVKGFLYTSMGSTNFAEMEKTGP